MSTIFGGKSDEIRFNFTHSSLAQIREGLERIKQTLKEMEA